LGRLRARRFLAASAVLGFAACKTPYQKEGATPEDFERDKYVCLAEARAGSWGWGFPRARDQGLFAKCLEARGWSQKPKEVLGEVDAVR
jgi:hypothetical protein